MSQFLFCLLALAALLFTTLSRIQHQTDLQAQWEHSLESLSSKKINLKQKEDEKQMLEFLHNFKNMNHGWIVLNSTDQIIESRVKKDLTRSNAAKSAASDLKRK